MDILGQVDVHAYTHHKKQTNMVIITGSPKLIMVIQASRASVIHCGPAELEFGWPNWPARDKVKHGP